jgi:glutaredoxin-like protein
MSTSQSSLVRVFWRPGCLYCTSLRHGLRATGLPFEEINIWADRGAAGLVRTAANGNETVPTVLVGDHALVNPSVRRVLAAVRAVAPQLAAELPESPPGLLARLASRLRRRARA